MSAEQFLPLTLSAIAGLTMLVIMLRLKWRDERDRCHRLRTALMEIELERINRPSKQYHARFGGESE